MAYPKELMDKALSILSQRRADARRAASAHREEIAQKLPQVIAIEQELARTSVQVSRAILSGENLEKNWLPCGMGTWPSKPNGQTFWWRTATLPTIWRSITSAPNAATPASVTTTCATACAAF